MRGPGCRCSAIGPLAAVPDEPVDTREQAARSLKSMRRSLERWLAIRAKTDAYAAGERPVPLLRKLGRAPLPPPVVKATLARDRYEEEQDLATTLRQLLLELGLDAARLPAADVAKDPEAAAKLARIAVAGKLPEEIAVSPQPQGLFWLLIPAGAVVLVLNQLIKSKADIAIEKERIRCVQSGACSDTSPLVFAGVGVAGFLLAKHAWTSWGVGDRVRKAFK